MRIRFDPEWMSEAEHISLRFKVYNRRKKTPLIFKELVNILLFRQVKNKIVSCSAPIRPIAKIYLMSH